MLRGSEMKSKLYVRILAVGILFVLIFSIIIPISFGYNVKTSPYVNKSEITDISDKETDWWPMIHHDIHHTGFSTSHAYDYLSHEWTYKGTSPFHSPTIYQNKLYVGSNDHKVYCLNAFNGEIIWSYETDGAVATSPAVYDGRIYFGSCDNKVYCLDASDGDFIWSYKTMDRVYCSPNVNNGRVYVGSDDNYVYCLDAMTGTRIWYHHNQGRIWGSPVVYNDYVLFGVGDAGNFVCVNRFTGQTVWGVQTGGGSITASPVIYDGNVYFGTYAYHMACFNASNGGWVWTKDIGQIISDAAAIAYGTVYVVGHIEQRLFCLNASDGDTIWSYKAQNYISGSPIVADGKVYIISEENLLYCFNCLSGQILWTYDIGGSINYGSPIIADGIIYIATLSSEIHSFKTQENNNPPTLPSVTGPSNGKSDVKYDFNISSIDLDNNPIFYFVDWGDDTNSGWIGEYTSDQNITLSHAWSWGDTFTFKVKAKDVYGFESDWTEFEINIVEMDYENTNCFVMGRTTNTWNRDLIDDNICFGYLIEGYHDFRYPASGWIYTNGDNGRWYYNSISKGKFNGRLGSDIFIRYDKTRITYYYGIKDFRGLSFGGRIFSAYPGGGCIFIGHAEHVKIRMV